VQPNGKPIFAEKIFTPVRFGIFLALLVFASFPQVVLGLETFVARDFGFFAYPLAHFQQQCFQRGEIPFWNPYNNCGVPFLAQWNTMPLYPPSLFYLLLPLKWSLGMFSLLHLWWAGFGMYFLARRWTGNNFAAAFAGVAFAFNGFALNLIMWPSHMATFSWLPWVVLLAESAWREGGKKIFLAAIAGALQMLAGGPEIILFTWLIVSALWLQQFIFGESPRGAMLWRFPLVVALVISLTLAQLLPFLNLVAHAQRETGFADLRWSMPGFGLANFLVPMAFGSATTEGIFFQHGQYWTSSYYLGVGTLWLALLAVLGLQANWQKIVTVHGKPIRILEFKLVIQFCARLCGERVWLLTTIAIAGLIFALGENTSVLPFVRKLLPQLSFITYPIKYITVVIFAAPLLAAFALANFAKAQKKLLPLGGILFALLVGILFWTQLAPLRGDDSHAALLSGFSRAVFLILTGAILFALSRGTDSIFSKVTPLFLILTAWLDVSTHEPAQNPTVSPGVYELNLARTKLALNPQPELGGARAMVSPLAANEFVTFALSDPKNNFLAKRLGACANANLLDAVPKVDGFFSLTPRENDAVLSLFYTTTNASYPGLEDFLGVAQITAPDEVFHWQARTNFLPLVTAGQKPVFLDEQKTLAALTQNDFDGGEVVFLPEQSKMLVTVTHPTAAKILKSNFGDDTVDIEVQADAPSLVVVAQTYYHNWQAEVDGNATPLLRANVAFQAVQIPVGRHTIHLFYRDRAFEIGAAMSICAWAFCCVSLLLQFRCGSKKESPPA
jgi:hypothetical protein